MDKTIKIDVVIIQMTFQSLQNNVDVLFLPTNWLKIKSKIFYWLYSAKDNYSELLLHN